MKTQTKDRTVMLREVTPFDFRAVEIREREKKRTAAPRKSSSASTTPVRHVGDQALVESFERLGHSPRAARIAAAGRWGLREASAPTKHEVPGGEREVVDDTSFEGGDFAKSDYAYTPSNDPDTWWGLLTMTPGGEPDPTLVRGAVMAIDPSNPIDSPGIPEADLPGVLAKVAKAWRQAIPDEEVPAILTAEAAAFLRLGVPLKGLNAAARGRMRRF